MWEKASFYQNILGVTYFFQPFQRNVYACFVSGEIELILMDTARLQDFHAAFSVAVLIDKSSSPLSWHCIYAHTNYLHMVPGKGRWVQSLTATFKFWAQYPFFE